MASHSLLYKSLAEEMNSYLFQEYFRLNECNEPDWIGTAFPFRASINYTTRTSEMLGKTSKHTYTTIVLLS